MQIVVGVQYKPSTKTYYFNPEGKEYEVGTAVIVENINGATFGYISETNKEVDDSEVELPLKRVLKVATKDDMEKVEALKQKAKKVTPIIEQKVADCKLKMKIVDVEYSFDEAKIMISFTAEARVDFRELLKALASTLHTKIELRQIGTRDEVKTVGGLGLCGMPCCCTRFLNEPEHITVKMVKLQNLSLSPTKTGGLCGRMMCCLKYEDSVYRELIENLPKVGAEIETPMGKGKVQYNDILKQRVAVKIFGKDDNYTIEHFSLDELKGVSKKDEVTKEDEIEELSTEKEQIDINEEIQEVQENLEKESEPTNSTYNEAKKEEVDTNKANEKETNAIKNSTNIHNRKEANKKKFLYKKNDKNKHFQNNTKK